MEESTRVAENPDVIFEKKSPEKSFQQLFSKKTSLIVGGIVLVILVSIGAVGLKLLSEKHATKSTTVMDTATSFDEEKIIRLVNRQRRAKNLPRLRRNTLLTNAADEELDQLVKNQEWDHISTKGGEDFLKKEKYNYETLGQNFAKGYITADEVITYWLHDKKSKEQLVNPSYTESGVAVRKIKIGGKDTVVVLQLFANQKKENVQISIPVKTPVATVTPKNQVMNYQSAAIKNYCGLLASYKASAESARGSVSDEDVNHLIDLYNRQIDFCNTLLPRIGDKTTISNDDAAMWDAISKLSYESSALFYKIFGN